MTNPIGETFHVDLAELIERSTGRKPDPDLSDIVALMLALQPVETQQRILRRWVPQSTTLHIQEHRL